MRYKSGSLAPRELPRFRATMVPSDPRRTGRMVIDSHTAVRVTNPSTPGLPGSLTSPSARAAPNHPGQAQWVLLVSPLGFRGLFPTGDRLQHLWELGHLP